MVDLFDVKSVFSPDNLFFIISSSLSERRYLFLRDRSVITVYDIFLTSSKNRRYRGLLDGARRPTKPSDVAERLSTVVELFGIISLATTSRVLIL